MSKVFLSLGTNIGNRKVNITNALAEISSRIGDISALSQVYETGAWGFVSENFLNQVVEVNSYLDPFSLIEACLEIEKNMGRVRHTCESYSSRVIDIDVLFFEDLIIENEALVVPHPHIQARRFILIPLCELAAKVVHPVFNKTISQLLDECSDEGMVKPFSENT
jgi:2-amino-4-hydroxy-6-hydroxymethyldihydropteridine diphosphokinase